MAMEKPWINCLYCNHTSQMVILRCIGPNSFFYEKVLFPWEDWCFSCPSCSRVDIWTHGLSGAELVDSFEAQKLSEGSA
jgi:hypothetical protein